MAKVAAAADTGYSGLEKREAPRFVLLLRPAKIIARCGEYLCILRDVGDKGVRLRLFHPLPSDPQMVLELGNGDRYDVEKVWEREDQAGLTFLHAADLTQLLEERSRFRKRQVRIRLEVPARLTAAGVAFPATLTSLSQQGGGIESEAPLATDQVVQLDVPGLPTIQAKVRWRRTGHAGLIFEQTFKLDELARQVVRLRPIPPPMPTEEEEFLAKVRARS